MCKLIYRSLFIVVILTILCAATSYSEDIGFGPGYMISINSVFAPDADSKGKMYYISSAMKDIDNKDQEGFQDIAGYLEHALLLSKRGYLRVDSPDKADLLIRILYGVGKAQRAEYGMISGKTLIVRAYDLKDPGQPQVWGVDLYSKDGSVDENPPLEMSAYMVIAAMPYFGTPSETPSGTQFLDGKKSILVFLNDTRVECIKTKCRPQKLASDATLPAKLSSSDLPVKAETTTYVANFNYTPDSQKPPGSAGVTFAVAKVVYKYQPASKITWFNFPQLVNLPNAIRRDVSEILAARGFSVRGPFDSYDLIPYPDKKTIDLYLTPTIELSIATPKEAYSMQDIKIEVTGRIILELREIVTKELMWVKSIPLTKYDFSFVPGAIKWKGLTDNFDVFNKKIKKSIASLEFGTVNMNDLAKGLEKQYPDIMATINKLIDPEEMRIIKKQCQELKSKRGY